MKWMLKCRENTILVTKSLDQKLSLSERLEMKLHLAMCGVCKRYAQQLNWLDDAFRKKMSKEKLSPEALDRICKHLENPHSTGG
jgi:hypothetical protein